MDWYLGEIRLFAFPRVPTGWAACNGELLSIAEYTTLYTLIGTIYGGDGIMVFKVPDLRGRVPLSFGQAPGQPAYPLGQKAGNEQVSLTIGQMPSHDHRLLSTQNAATTDTPGTTVHLATITPDTKTLYAPRPAVTSYDVMAPLSVRNAGSGAGHNNMMPSLVMNYCIATTGIYPSN